MSKLSLNDLIAGFSAAPTNSGGDDSYKKFFPFYKADTDTTTTIRFLPDRNADNPRGFIVENIYHELNVNGRKERVACLRALGEDHCPACAASAAYYDEANPNQNVALGKSLYRKKSYIAQVLVLESTVPTNNPDRLVNLIDFGPQIYTQIFAGLRSGDLENNPTDFQGGHNFRIRKTLNGTENSYATSSFAAKTSDVPNDMLEQIESEMYDLSEHGAKYVPAQVMETMVQAAISSQGTGGSYGQQRQAAQTQQARPMQSQAAPARQAAPVHQNIGEDDPSVGREEVRAAPATQQAAAPAQGGVSSRDSIRARAAALRNNAARTE